MSNGLNQDAAHDFLSSLSTGSSDPNGKHNKARRAGQHRGTPPKPSVTSSKPPRRVSLDGEAKNLKPAKLPSTPSAQEETTSKSPPHGPHHKQSDPIHTPSKLRSGHSHTHRRYAAPLPPISTLPAFLAMDDPVINHSSLIYHPATAMNTDTRARILRRSISSLASNLAILQTRTRWKSIACILLARIRVQVTPTSLI